MMNKNIKKYAKNTLICYLALLTGCSSNIDIIDNSSVREVRTKNPIEKEKENTNLPTMDLKERYNDKSVVNKISDKKYINNDFLESKNTNTSRNKTGNEKDLNSMAIGLANDETTDYIQNWFSQKHMTAEVAIGAGENGIKTGSFDLLVPLYDKEKDLFFTQLGARRSNRFTEDYRNTVNIGVGYRHTLDKWLLGVNTFYDKDITGSNERVGLGLEAWTDYLKLSGNSYIRLSDWQQSKAIEDYQERPANGWDAKAEAYLPQYPQLGGKIMYEQYYGDEVGLFGSSSRQKDPNATTLGLSYTPVPLISMSTDYRQGQNGISETSVRLGLNLQLGVSMKKQLSSDELVSSRMLSNMRYNLVSRNNEIVLDFKKNETGYINLPASLVGNANDTIMFPIMVTGEVKNISWVGTASPYTRVYGGSAMASIILPPYNQSGINVYTLKAVGTDKYGKVIESNVMNISVEINKITVESSSPKVIANGKDLAEFTATLSKNNLKVVNSDIQWNIQGNATVVHQDSKTNENGQASISLNSSAVNEITVIASDSSGAKAQSVVQFYSNEDDAKISDITLNQDIAYADGVSLVTLKAQVNDKEGKKVGAGITVNWSATLGTLSDLSSKTDADGYATITLKSNKIGNSKVVASTKNSTYETIVNFEEPQSASARVTTITSSEGIAYANGVSKISLTALVVDKNNKPLGAGIPVNWSTTLGILSINKTETDENGKALVTITSIQAGNGIVKAFTDKGAAEINVVFNTVPSVESKVSNITSSSKVVHADGITYITLTALVINEDGKPVGAGIPVNWTTTLGNLSNEKSETDADGKAVIYITSKNVGNATVKAITGNSSSETNITFDEAPVIENKITITSDKDSVDADGVSKVTISVVIKDVNDKPVSGVDVNWSKDIADVQLSSEKTVTDNEGKTSIQVLSGKTKGTLSITATTKNGISKKEIILSEPKISASSIDLSTDRNTLSADGESFANLIATLKDANGKSLPAGIEIEWTTDNGTLSNAKTITDNNGQSKNIITTSDKAGISTVTVKSGNISKPISIMFEPESLEIFSMSESINTIKADGIEETVISALVKDGNGNNVGSGFKVKFESDFGRFAQLSNSYALTDNSGVASITFKGILAGQATIFASIDNTLAFKTINVSLAPITEYTTTLSIDKTRIRSNGLEKARIVAHVKNNDGTPAKNIKLQLIAEQGILSSYSGITNSNGDYEVDFSSIEEGTSSIIAIANGSSQEKAAFTSIEVFDSGKENQSYNLILDGSKNIYAEDNSENYDSVYGTINVILRDKENNPIVGKEILIECISGSSCLSNDGTSVMEPVRLITNSRGQVKSDYRRVKNDRSGDLIFRASLVEDDSLYKIFNVSQRGLPDGLN